MQSATEDGSGRRAGVAECVPGAHARLDYAREFGDASDGVACVCVCSEFVSARAIFPLNEFNSANSILWRAKGEREGQTQTRVCRRAPPTQQTPCQSASSDPIHA